MKLHTHVHHGKKPYTCDSCGKSYTSVSGLKTHWKTHAPCSGPNDEERLARIKQEFASMHPSPCGHANTSKLLKTDLIMCECITDFSTIFILGAPVTQVDTANNELILSTQNGVTISHIAGGDHMHDHHHQHHHRLHEDDEGEDDSMDEAFDEDIPQHRRMTVTRVTDHAELADSVLSAQSAPTINISPMSPPCPPEVTRSIIIESHQLPLKREETV